MNDLKYMVWLAHAYGVDAYYIDYLLKVYGSAEGVYRSGDIKLRTGKVIPEKTLLKIANMKKNIDPDKVLAYMERRGIKYIPKFSPEYPPLLKTIANPPPGLFILGRLPGFDKPWVSVIGTRRPTAYGKTAAYKISKELAEKGVVLVSGMADGLDGVAHRAALDMGGVTIAVLGSGVDVCYPSVNEKIYEDIKETGCIISEFPPMTKTDKWHFPYRNRIISGVSEALVVVEAEIASGTSITVNCALEQGREVLAVPGNITSPKSSGTNKLLREGAHVATCGADVLDVLGIIEPSPLNNSSEEIHNNAHITLAPEEKTVYSLLDNESLDLDDIIKKTGLAPQNVMVALTRLELAGLANELPGQRYIKRI